MNHLTTTPFGRRSVTVADRAARLGTARALPSSAPDKWAILKDLSTARRAYGLSDRTIAVLAALVSFHPARTLEADGPLVVHPSNATLATRAHGMPESTLRRHISALVQAGLILRHDSPNGKRYVRRNASGGVDTAFGFDLTPLAHRAAEIGAAADTARRNTERLKQMRETATLTLRDATKLLDLALAQGAPLDETAKLRLNDLGKRLRRKMENDALDRLLAEASAFLAAIEDVLQTVETASLSAEGARNERHIQDSEPKNLESETTTRPSLTNQKRLPLSTVLDTCPSLEIFSTDPIRTWPDLVRAADAIHPMLGISGETWRHATQRMGPAIASTTLACILESTDRIRDPGAYLRSLAKKAEKGRFSPVPMIAALNARSAAVRPTNESRCSTIAA
jgi:replication initiation protein RepC